MTFKAAALNSGDFASTSLEDSSSGPSSLIVLRSKPASAFFDLTIDLDARDDAQLDQMLAVPQPVRALGGARAHTYPCLQRLVAGGAKGLERAQNRFNT